MLHELNNIFASYFFEYDKYKDDCLNKIFDLVNKILKKSLIIYES
jgi:hypothetical protein